ncbi:MAG: L,D-transpeptidase [Oxalobacteraceae bacterium]
MKTQKFLTIFIVSIASAASIAAQPLTSLPPLIPLTPDTLSATGRVQPVGPNTKGAAVLRAQVLLDRAHFSSGEIDAAYGSNLRQAIEGYQKAGGLEVTGIIDGPTWDALNVDTALILTPYTLLDTDLAGPFEPIPKKMANQAKMASLGYASAAEALGEKFHLSPKLLALLNPGKDFGRAGEQIVVPNIAAVSALPKAAKVIVDESKRTLTLVDAGGKTIAQFPATTGSKHDPLPLGNWKVTGIARNPVFHYNPKLFWDANPGDTKTTIPSGPNNPVGVVWVDLSKEHYGIHGTPEPSRIGKTQSHGCIRLTNWDAAALAQSVAGGVDVLLQK